jgi:hypothetical protein
MARSGRRDGTRFPKLLDACLASAADGQALFPVSDATIHEVTGIVRHRKQRDLQQVSSKTTGQRSTRCRRSM